MKPYRGQRIDGKGWVYGWYFRKGKRTERKDHFVWADYIITMENGPHRGPSTYEVIPESVGQSIGLKDKDGVEIYGGDIVGLEEYGPGQVYWCDKDLAWRVIFDDLTNEFLSEFDSTEIYVIGNIHQHPQLLEK